MEINVKKRDGSIEPWNYDKLVTAVSKAGMPITVSEEVAAKVRVWVAQNASVGVIMSSDIKDKIIEEITPLDPVAAENFKVYKKS